MTDTPKPTAAETLADMILRAAGSGLRHYVPANRAAIIKAADAAINAIKVAGLFWGFLAYSWPSR